MRWSSALPPSRSHGAEVDSGAAKTGAGEGERRRSCRAVGSYRAARVGRRRGGKGRRDALAQAPRQICRYALIWSESVGRCNYVIVSGRWSVTLMNLNGAARPEAQELRGAPSVRALRYSAATCTAIPLNTCPLRSVVFADRNARVQSLGLHPFDPWPFL